MLLRVTNLAETENEDLNPVSSKYVGNDQACGNCHTDTGRLARSAPLWAAWVAYPAYRAKNHKVNTYIERIQGCFEYSMNAQASAAGGAPAADSDTMVSLVAYSFWLAKGAPTGDDTLPGRGYPRLQAAEQGFDPERGTAVYAAQCALCQGDLTTTTEQFHGGQFDYYGKRNSADGSLLGEQPAVR